MFISAQDHLLNVSSDSSSSSSSAHFSPRICSISAQSTYSLQSQPHRAATLSLAVRNYGNFARIARYIIAIGAMILTTYVVLAATVTFGAFRRSSASPTVALDEFSQIKNQAFRKIENEAKLAGNHHQHIVVDNIRSSFPRDHHRYSVIEHDSDHAITARIDSSYADCGYHLAFTLIEQANSQTNHFTAALIGKFSATLSSILLRINATNLDSGALCIHLITDAAVRPLINDVIVRVHEDLVRQSMMQSNFNDNHRHHHHHHSNENEASNDDHQDDQDAANHDRPLTKYFFIDSAAIESRLDRLLPTLRAYFTHKPNSYYANALFFYSMVLHQVIPARIADRIILLDVDVKLDANLLRLYEEFGRFAPDQVIGIAHEQQPVYRHILHEYRHTNRNTTVGEAPPRGFPGYNSGVLLLHLRKMRESFVYNSLLNDAMIGRLCRKYRFRGHLGDQDFYTIAALDYPQLFRTLDCGWNRQLCQWWRFHGYGAVFDAYHRCDSPIKLYHGNCNSALPTLTSYGEYRRR